ncbi:MAG TPA: GMC family oxidoreductase [Chthoniobacteraceae bacterium]|jgi:choline dehydrogenase-like flavoprotein|nr:GMC family oxidoreductase [Chthoniobacteraceae bacterium]
MPVITPRKTLTDYDAIIVGSGAAGGMSAYVLSKAGLKVLMLEAGRNYDPITETPMFETPKDAPLRGAPTPDKHFGYFDSTVQGGWSVPNEPYMVRRSDQPGWHEATDINHHGTKQNFMWWRPRMLGGRTNHWGRIALRMGPYDFKPKARDGLGLDWPINYEDLAPWYDQTEALIGVYGSNEGLENTPDSSPGVLQPPPKPRGYELLIKRGAGKLGIPVVPSHQAILTRAINGRAACFYATDCGRGCSIKANFQSTTVLIPPAVETGNLDVITDAMVREVTIDKTGKATGVHYVDKATGQDLHAKARVVILSASGCESARILLNSKSALFPNGLANTSGKIGRYLMDSVGTGVSGHIPAMESCPPHNEDGASAMHMYIPWWQYKEQLAGKLGFARGYHVELGGGRRMPTMSNPAPEKLTGGSYGRQFKEDARRYYGSHVSLTGRGEMIPNEKSFCEIHPEVKDKWGIPVLRFHWEWSEHEIKQAAHMQKTFVEIIEAMGGKPDAPAETDGAKAILAGGTIIHEVGTTCMGFTKNDSVVNQWCQTWDVPNLFVTDSGPFVSNADKNPTLSILALAMRSCSHLAEEMKKGSVG